MISRAKNFSDVLNAWLENNMQGIQSDLLRQHDKAKQYFTAAKQNMHELHFFSIRSSKYRELANICRNEAGLCNNRADSYAECMQYEFCINFLTNINSEHFTGNDRRLLAQTHLQLADAISRLPDEKVPGDCFKHANEAIALMEQLPLQDWQPDDRRFLSKCYHFLSTENLKVGYYRAANEKAEKAIAMMLAIPMGARVEKDEVSLQACRRLAADAEFNKAGCWASLKNYGLFARTSKTESYSAKQPFGTPRL